VEIRVRNIKAVCPCGSSEFLTPKEQRLTARTLVTCAQCGKQRFYSDLLDDIGEEAIRQARDALERMTKKKPPK
jgi:hypothetical protein